MKAAVSLPDTLLEAADELAKRLGISRSELFAALDPVMAAIQSASLARDDSEREQELLAMFNEAAVEATEDDLGERQSLLSGFPSRSKELESATAETRSFLSVACSLELEGPPDWSARLDEYHYGSDEGPEPCG